MFVEETLDLYHYYCLLSLAGGHLLVALLWNLVLQVAAAGPLQVVVVVGVSLDYCLHLFRMYTSRLRAVAFYPRTGFLLKSRRQSLGLKAVCSTSPSTAIHRLLGIQARHCRD